ncbi:YHS domain-containing (seleno)protein [Spongiimicrobium salis]|uniref:YHS domain-containing (seleno)protein n=1 Tax=Spongiimicrobium salis TaxID=1667022 RepID=UPI00374DEF02
MKKYHFLILLVILTSTFSYAQKSNYNQKKGFVAQGYDVVAYFDHEVKKGVNDFSTTHDGAKFRFSSAANLEKFKANPKKYVPQYGGWCAYAIGKNGKKVKINPETYEIRDGKLYLFYNAGSTNTLEIWLKEGAEQLLKNADKNWQKIITKN